MKKRVVIDCDPGIDDAMALLMAFASEELDVRAVTTVAGNVPVHQTTENALRIAALANQTVEVAVGAEQPLVGEHQYAKVVHGGNGLGGVELPDGGKPSSRGAVELLIDEIEKGAGELILIALGPLTNIARLLIEISPSKVGKIKGINLMGGGVFGGNVTPSAEFNFHSDPHAADIVFNSGVPISMYGLNVTNQALLYPADIRAIRQFGGTVITKLTAMMECYLTFYRAAGHPGMGMHDPFAVACAIDASLAGMKHLYVEIETEKRETMGRSKVDVQGETGKKPNAQVAMTIDKPRFLSLFTKLMKFYS